MRIAELPLVRRSRWCLRNTLKSELEQLGFQEISLDENGYLFATWPANTDKPVPTIGFIARYDTSPDMTVRESPTHCLWLMTERILYYAKKTTLYFLLSNFPNCWIIKGGPYCNQRQNIVGS